MLQYPSIPSWKKSRIGESCIAFYKYDGSNIRVEWSPKKGWYKFGSRTQLFDHTSDQFADAIPLFLNGMADDIVGIVCKDNKRKVERIVAFTEYFGKNSFAGTHHPEDKKDLVLIDVSVYKQGFMEPRKFVKLFSSQPWAARVVYEGNMNKQFIEDVQMSWSYEGPLADLNLREGVVCKGDEWRAKIKTFTYRNMLKRDLGDAWEQYWE